MSVPEPFDPMCVDQWAVNLVVREGVRMNLNEHERVVAAVQMRDTGIKAPEIADRMRCTVKDVEALWRRWARYSPKSLTV